METQQSLTQAGISMFLSFGAKSVKPEILEKLLVGRQKTVDMLTQQATDIAQNGMNAQLMLIGNRGMGKTHVLRVLYHRIQPLVQSRQLVVAYFIEEAYDVARYLDFLVRIIKDFIRWYEADAEVLQQKLAMLRETPSYRQEELAEQIIADYVADKPLLILTENFDTILEALGKNGQAKLRSWLYRHNRISIMATAQALSPDLGREDRPFYQFFTAIYLKRLSYEDSLELLQSLARTDQNQAVIDHLKGKGIGQVRAIHELVKGNHRLLVTFYEFLKADTLAKLSDIFMKTLNDLKPYYETYIRYLPPQQQKIVHYLALAVTPRNGTDISKDCFIEQKSLSKQLSDLQRRHLLDAHTDPADGRNKLYDLTEPLLRISLAIGEHTQGITPLFIDFLANWYNLDDLQNQKQRFWDLHLSEPNEKLKQDYLFDYEARVKALALKESINANKQDSKLYRELREEFWKGNYEKVKNLAQKIPTKEQDARYFSYLGYSFYESGFYNEAIEYYQKAIDIKPDYFTAYNVMGNSYSAKGNTDKAIECYQEAIDINPDYYEAFNNMGNAYFVNGDTFKAIEYYEKAIGIKPAFYGTFYNLANIYHRNGKEDKAIDNYEKTINLKPDFYEAFYNLGNIYRVKNDYRKALKYYQKAIETGVNYIKTTQILKTKLLMRVSPMITYILQNDKSLSMNKIQYFEKLIEEDYGMPDELKISYLMLQTYHRYVLEKDKRAIYELPKEQREFFLREIVGEA